VKRPFRQRPLRKRYTTIICLFLLLYKVVLLYEQNSGFFIGASANLSRFRESKFILFISLIIARIDEKSLHSGYYGIYPVISPGQGMDACPGRITRLAERRPFMDSDQGRCRIGIMMESGIKARCFIGPGISVPPVFRRKENTAHDTEQPRPGAGSRRRFG
jgi:hypothetical protein